MPTRWIVHVLSFKALHGFSCVGVAGALFNFCNEHITLFRRRFITKPWQKVRCHTLIFSETVATLNSLANSFAQCLWQVVEVLAIVALTVFIKYTMSYFVYDCHCIEDSLNEPGFVRMLAARCVEEGAPTPKGTVCYCWCPLGSYDSKRLLTLRFAVHVLWNGRGPHMLLRHDVCHVL